MAMVADPAALTVNESVAYCVVPLNAEDAAHAMLIGLVLVLSLAQPTPLPVGAASKIGFIVALDNVKSEVGYVISASTELALSEPSALTETVTVKVPPTSVLPLEFKIK